MHDNSRIPKYEIIATDLEQDLINQKYSYGERLPSETELMETYDVSRITARKALADLEAQGLIYKIQGKGCFASISQKRQSLLQIHSYTKEILNAGMTPKKRILSCQVRLGTEEEIALLKLSKENKVFCLERLIFADEQVLCQTRAVLPYHLFPKIERYDFHTASLYDIIESEYHTKIYHTSMEISPVCAEQPVAAHMLLPEHTPLILTENISTTKTGNKEIPIELSSSYYNTRVIKYSIDKYN